MLSVNNGNGIDTWVKLEEGHLDPWFEGTAGCAHFCLTRALRLSAARPPADGTPVLALDAPTHALRRAVVGAAKGARRGARVAGTAHVTFAHDGSVRMRVTMESLDGLPRPLCRRAGMPQAPRSSAGGARPCA